jgi:secreted trypsin-like serine protease
MKCIIFLIFLISTSNSFQNKTMRRILNGEVTEPQNFLYSVAIISTSSGYMCSGTFIDEYWILTVN